MIHTAIAGFGKAAEIYHCPFLLLLPEFKLVKVLERRRQRSKELYPWVQIVRDYAAILEDKSIDLVIITTPNEFHYPMVKAALEAGKHVVVDKPFTCHVWEGEELLQLAAEKNRVLTVYHNRRLDGPVQEVRQIMRKKLVGKPRKLEIRFDRYRPEINKESWREQDVPGNGILYDLGSHLVDIALSLVGKPDSIKKETRVERIGAEATDFFKIEFFYPDFTVELEAGMLVREKTPHIILTGEGGQLTIPDLDPQEAALKQGLKPNDEEWPKTFPGFLKRGNEMEKCFFNVGDYTAFYRNLSETIIGKQKLLVKPAEALEVIRIIER